MEEENKAADPGDTNVPVEENKNNEGNAVVAPGNELKNKKNVIKAEKIKI